MTPPRRELSRGILAFGLGPAVAVVTAPLLARVLGPDGRGQLAGILQPLTLADALAVFGLPAAVTYFTARGGSARAIERRAWWVTSVSATAAFLLLVAYSVPVARAQGLDTGLLLVVWVSVIPGAFIAVRRARLAGQLRWRLLDAERGFAAIGRLAAIVALALAGATSVYVFALGPIIVGLASSFVLLFVIVRAVRVGASAERVDGTALMRFAGFSSVAVVASAANARIDQALFASVGTSEEAGYYAAAVALAEIPLVVAALLQRNLGAEIAAGAPSARTRRTLAHGTWIAVAAAIVTMLLTPIAVRVAFGQEFEPSIGVAQVLVVGILGTCAMMVGGAILNGMGRPGLSAIPFATSALGVAIWILAIADKPSAHQLAVASAAAQLVGGVIAAVLARHIWASQRSLAHGI